MSGKKVLSLMIAVVLAAGACTTTAMAAAKKRITTVNLTVEAEVIPGGSVFEQQVEIIVKNNNITVGCDNDLAMTLKNKYPTFNNISSPDSYSRQWSERY